MTCLTLLFACSHEIERALIQFLLGQFGCCHITLGIVVCRLLIPVAHISCMMDIIEGAQREGTPFIISGIGPACIYREAESAQVGRLDSAQHIRTGTYQQRCGGKSLTCCHTTGSMVHASCACIFILEGLHFESCGVCIGCVDGRGLCAKEYRT